MILGPRKNSGIVHILFIVVALLLPNAVFSEQPAQGVKILVLPFHVTSAGEEKELATFGHHVQERIRSAITQLGEHYVLVTEQATVRFLKGRAAPTSDDEAHLLGTQSGSDLVVFGFISGDKSFYQMRGVMLDLRTGRVSVTTDLKVRNIHGLPGVLQVFINTMCKRLHGSPLLPLYKTEPAAPTGQPRPDRLPSLVALPKTTGPWRSPEIHGTLSGLDIGDLDGDGKNETLFLEQGGITISRYEGGSLRPLSQFSQSPAAYVSAQVEDLDGDGVAELLLCYETPSAIESAVVTYRDRNLKVLAKLPNMILRAVADPSDPGRRVLLGQSTEERDFFSGRMVRFRLENGKPERDGELMLPPGTFLLSYASGHLGRKKEFYQVILNQDQRLMVFDRDNRLIQTVDDRIYGLDRRLRVPVGNKYVEIVYPGPLLIADTDANGESELLVVKQSSDGGEIQALAWDGAHLSKKWNSVPMRGIISDFSLRDFKNQGTPALVLILVKPNPFLTLSGPRSVIFAFDVLP